MAVRSSLPARRRDRPRDRRRGAPGARRGRRLRATRSTWSAAPRSTPTARALTDEVLEACRGADAVLLGAVGGPKWDTHRPRRAAARAGAARPAQGPRPVREPAPGEAERGAARRQPAAPRSGSRGTDLLVVRELTGGIYFGDAGRDGDRAHDDLRLHGRRDRADRPGRLRGGRRARDAAGVTSVDKANVLETSRLWRETVERVAGDYADVELDHLLVDNAAMQLVSDPSRFDVIVTENMFGDILSDEAAMLTGSLGMLPSASLGDDGPGLFEPVHGSAPDIAGKGVANPLATFLSVGDDAAPRARDGGRGRARSRRPSRRRSARRPAHAPTSHTGADGRAPRSATEEMTDAVHRRRCSRIWTRHAARPRHRSADRGEGRVHLDERRVRRLGRRQGPRPQPRAPLRHRRLRGHPLPTRPSAGRRSFAIASTSSGSQSRPSSTTCRCPTSVEELREATHELIRRNGLAQLLHPPARLPRLRRDGPLRADGADRRDGRGLALGRLPRRGGQAQRDPRQGLLLAADLARRPDPAREGVGPVPELDPRQDREPPRPATTRRSCSTTRGMVCEGSGENIFVVRDGEIVTPGHTRLDPRRDQPQVGDPDRRATSATRWSSATSPAPSSTWPRRSSSRGTAAELVPVREIDDHDARRARARSRG